MSNIWAWIKEHPTLAKLYAFGAAILILEIAAVVRTYLGAAQ